MNKFIFYNQRQNTDFLPYLSTHLCNSIRTKSKYVVLLFALMFSYAQKQYAQTFTAGLLHTGENCSNMVSTIAQNSAGEMYMLYIGGNVVSLNQVYYLKKWSTVTNTWTSIGSFTAASMNTQIGWNIFDEDVSMAIDASNGFHIVLRGRKDLLDRGPVYVYSANGTSWNFSIISSTNLQNAGEAQYTLKLDASGNPHLTTRYSQLLSPTFVYKVVYHKKNGATWQSEDIVAQTGVQQNEVQRPDLEISPNGDVHITCIRETNGSSTDGSLYYYKKANGSTTWAMTQINTGTTNNPATTQHQMELLPNGNISIMNMNSTSALNISEYIYDGTTWQNTAVTNGFFDRYSYAVNSNGDRFLGYKASNLNANTDYFYATKPSSASSWTLGTIYTDPAGNITIKRSVMLNSAGKLLTGFERYSGASCGAATPKLLWYAYAELPPSQSCTNPTAFAVTGGGTYCVGGAGLAVGLANSESGVTYQLQKDNVNEGSPENGTGSAISFGTKTAAGTYTVIATRTTGGCTANMTGNVSISTTPVLPAFVSIAATGNSINAGTSVTFTATPINGGTPTYQWKKNNNNVGTNSATYTDAGLANNDVITCVMTSSATCVSPATATSNDITMAVTSACVTPTAYAVTGGGAYCAGGTGFAVGLANSESGVNYQLQKDNVNDGSTVNGTGSAISFGTKTAAGTYTVIATRTVGACTANMTGSVAITINPLPVAYAVTGGGAYCAGGAGFAVGLANSESGVTYQLQKDNVNDGSTVNGTGSAISFGTKTAAGTYTVIATKGTCTANMTGSVAITINPLPVAYAVTGGGAYCAGGAGFAVGLANSESGVTYQLQKDNVNDGSAVNGTGSAISFGTKTAAGTYTVIATKGTCTANMTSSVAITINPAPVAYAVTGGGAYCAGGAGFAVGLANSESGVSYQLQKDNINDGSAVNGTGSAISFGTKIATGTYTVIATKGTCTANMTGSVAITINPAPSAYAVTGGGAYCAGGAGFAVGLANSESGVTYQLQKDNVDDGSAVSGTGAAISFGTKTAAGTYTVIATKGTCTANMTDSAVIRVNPLPPANAIPTVTASNNNPCAGTTVTLTATPPAGYTGQEYLWIRNGSSLQSVSGGNGQYPVNAGNTAVTNDYTVQMIYTGYVCLSNSSASNIVVTRAPQATITPNGATNFCSNTPTILSANTGMNNYVWKRGTTIAQVGGTNYTPTVTGTYNVTVTVTDAYGCTKTSSPLSITLKTLPTANAGADVPVCLGQSVQIGSTAVAGNTYTWSPTTGLSNAYIANPLASPNITRTYTVTVSNGTTGCTNTDAVVVTTALAPITPSLTSTTSGTNVTLTCSSPGATSVNWYKNGALLFSNKPINSSITVVASNPAKSYTVKSVAANGCFSSFSNNISARINNQKGGDALISIENDAFQVYPNPTNGLLNVVITNESLTTGKLLLSNSLGQVMIEKEVNLSAGKVQVELDMSQFATGIYHLSFGEYMQKIVKE